MLIDLKKQNLKRKTLYLCPQYQLEYKMVNLVLLSNFCFGVNSGSLVMMTRMSFSTPPCHPDTQNNKVVGLSSMLFSGGLA